MILTNNQSDEYFPRGGTGVKTLLKKRTFAFGRKEPQNEVPKKKLGRRERKRKAASAFEFENQDDGEIRFERVEPLVYNALSEGTLALCSIREIHSNYVDICMPGRLSARLFVQNISEPYNKISKNKNDEEAAVSLNNLFRIGQHLTCSVLSVKNADHYIVSVSSDPKCVNSHLTFDNVTVGSLIQMAVQSSEDHGYMMYSGIDGLTSFLPNNNAQSYINSVRSSKPLDIGQILWCLVTKSKISESSNKVQVTIDIDSIQTNKLETDINIEKLNPGTRVEVTINKLISQNLMVTINGSDIKGYIEPGQLSSMWSQPKDYTIGSKHTATVLYKFPYPKVAALTFKSNPVTISEQEIEHGTVFEKAEIMAILKRGVALKLEFNDNVYKGVISVRRLGPDIDSEKLSAMFPIGNHIKCRVIGFDALEQVYSCTTQDHLLNEKYFSPNDLKVGEIVEVIIECKKNKGLEVSVGEVRGFVPSHHVSDVLLQNPLDKLKLCSKEKAKVLKIENNNVIFTLRPTLVKTRSLVTFDNLNIGDSYFGTIKKINSDSITVTFFGNLYIQINEVNLIESPNKYHVGELVKCFVVGVLSGKKLPVFSLVKSIQGMDVTVGNKYNIRLKQISETGAKCLFFVKDKAFNGFLPLENMSDYRELCEQVMKNYPYYALINNARLFSVTDNTYTFSIKKSVESFFEKYPQIHEGFSKLKENMIMPATVSELMSDKIMVRVPVPGLNANVPINKKNLPQDPYEYDLNQGLCVKITKINSPLSEMTLSCRLTDKEKNEWSISHVENFLRTVEPLQSVKFGTELECTVREMKGNHLVIVSTPLSIMGLVKSPMLSKQSYKSGQKIKAVVLYHDVIKNIIYLIGPEEKEKMYWNSQTHLINHQVPGTVLYGNSVFLLAMIQAPKGRQLAFIPTKVDPNISDYTKINEIVPYSSCNVTLRSARTSDKINYWIGYADCLKKCEPENEDLEVSIIESDIATPMTKSNKRKFLDQITETGNSKKKAMPNENKIIEVVEKPNDKLKRKCETLNDGLHNKNSPNKQEMSRDHQNKKQKIEKKTLKKEIKQEPADRSLTLEDVGGFNWDATPADLTKAIVGIVENDDGDVGNILEKELFEEESLMPRDRQYKKQKIEKKPLKEEYKQEPSELEKEEYPNLTLEDVGGFKWDATPADLSKAILGIAENDGDNGELSQDSDEEKLPPKKMTPAEKRAAALEAEKKIRLKEEELLKAEENPQTPEHFERLLLGQPNSSKLWILYMAHHMEATEIEKARVIAKRAIKQINVRFEEERLNVWIASLNLEHFYGTPELFKEVLTEALKYNDEYEIHRRVLDIYAQSKNITELENLTNFLVKKYKEKLDCWLTCQGALMKAEMYDKARNYLQRSLSVLPIKVHCTLISRFALIENQYGFSEQAQALFENLLTSYPKRVDLWSVYVDMLVKSGSAHLGRNVLERATGHKLPVRKMKALYQKWLKLEEVHGTPESVQQVKDAANEYVNNLANSLK